MSLVETHFELQACPSATLAYAYDTRLVPTLSNGDRPMDVYIPREQGDLLYSLVRELQPKVTVEIGMANGLSTAFIAQALADNGAGRHIAIDPFQHSDWHGAGVALVRKAGLAHLVELVELPSHQGLPQLERDGIHTQFVFIDGSHLFDYVMTDFLCCDRILDVGGLMAFDDSDWPAITQVLRYAITNRHYEVACPEIVIEPMRYTPGIASRMIRGLGKSVPKLGERMRPDFTNPSHEMGIRGRCVVLRKLKDDDRNSQTKFHRPF
jgi:predicted O-methyltransferase YrrM